MQLVGDYDGNDKVSLDHPTQDLGSVGIVLEEVKWPSFVRLVEHRQIKVLKCRTGWGKSGGLLCLKVPVLLAAPSIILNLDIGYQSIGGGRADGRQVEL